MKSKRHDKTLLILILMASLYCSTLGQSCADQWGGFLLGGDGSSDCYEDKDGTMIGTFKSSLPNGTSLPEISIIDYSTKINFMQDATTYSPFIFYYPCHFLCVSCTVKWDKTACQSCESATTNAFKWL
jgi:hypothetical protein